MAHNLNFGSSIPDKGTRGNISRVVVKIADLYECEGHHWETWLANNDINKPQRGPQPKSRFHSIARHFLGLNGDDSGHASVLAAALDAWLAVRSTVSPIEIPMWIETQGGIRALYEKGKAKK